MELVQQTKSPLHYLKHGKERHLSVKVKRVFFFLMVLCNLEFLTSAYLAKQKRYGNCFTLAHKGQKEKDK
jgi:hypothetical protein